jgi:Na+/proline symporter
MKKIIERLLGLPLILLGAWWFLHSENNTFDDGYACGVMLMCLLYLVRLGSREIADTNVAAANAFKRISWLVLIVLTWIGTHWKHNFDQGFSAGILVSLTVWVLWPVLIDFYNSRSMKAKSKESHADQ